MVKDNRRVFGMIGIMWTIILFLVLVLAVASGESSVMALALTLLILTKLFVGWVLKEEKR